MLDTISDSKVYVANMGPIWGEQDPDGPHVGPMNFAIWDYNKIYVYSHEFSYHTSNYLQWLSVVTISADTWNNNNWQFILSLELDNFFAWVRFTTAC